MGRLLEMTVDEVLELVEEAAANGSARAERLLVTLLNEEAATGELGVISRLACTPILEPGRYAR
jgi:hypothetical protein